VWKNDFLLVLDVRDWRGRLDGMVWDWNRIGMFYDVWTRGIW